MGILDAIKDLLGSSGVGDLVESTGIAEHLGGITEAVQAPVEAPVRAPVPPEPVPRV